MWLVPRYCSPTRSLLEEVSAYSIAVSGGILQPRICTTISPKHGISSGEVSSQPFKQGMPAQGPSVCAVIAAIAQQHLPSMASRQ